MDGTPRLITLRRSDRCIICGESVAAGRRAWWDPEKRTVTCEGCGGAVPAPDLTAPIGKAGESARREHDRRVANDEGRVRSRHQHIGGLLSWLSDERTSTKVWKTGSVGELLVGKRLDPLVGEGMVVLHDVRLPRERANVDHVAVAPSGIHVIDSKLYRDKKIEIRKVGPLFSREPRLFVGGRDKTVLVEKMANQVMKIDGLIRDLPSAMQTMVTPVLCFVYGDWGFLGPPLSLSGVRIVWPKELVKLLRRPGPLTQEQINELGTRLATRLVYDG